MKLTIRKNCFGCRAISGESCSLGFKTTLQVSEIVPGLVAYPDEPCPKPMTYKQLFACKDAKKERT